MRITLIRSATIVLELADRRILVDPMLDPARARPPIENTANPVYNPTVELPFPAEEVVRGLDAVLVTHRHRDHFDGTAERLLPRDIPTFCQPEDAAAFRDLGLDARPIGDSLDWDGLVIQRVPARHGSGAIADALAPVSGFVLDDLVLEWKRTQRTLDTVSIDDIGELPEPVDVVHAGDATDYAWLRRAFERLDPTRALVLKLLYIEDWDLTAQEMRTLAETSGRSLAEVVRGIEDLRALVREREASLKDVEENLGTVLAWVQLFERRLWCIDAELAVRPSDRLRAEAAELRRKLERRQRQRTKLMGRAKRRQITAPYKAIAALFNTTVGNIASQIARARQELREKGLALQG